MKSPPHRNWIQKETLSNPANKYTIMQYNVLAERYAATSEEFPKYCPEFALDWSYRCNMILDDLKRRSADIITLQEVENGVFENFFMKELSAIGYAGEFVAKGRQQLKRIRENEERKMKVDGCATFYKTSRFVQIVQHKHSVIEYKKLAQDAIAMNYSKAMKERVEGRDHIGLVIFLAPVESGVADTQNIIAVCNTHIHWDEEFCDVKMVQAILLMNNLHQKLSEIKNSSVRLILSGDFNSLPGSGIVAFLQESRVSMDHPVFLGNDYSECLKKYLQIPEDSTDYTHAFSLTNAYDGTATDVEWTNKTNNFEGIIDYIFVDKSIKVLQVLGGVKNEWMISHDYIGCPNADVPSDHIPLVVEIEI